MQVCGPRSQENSIEAVCQIIQDEEASQNLKSLSCFSVVLCTATSWSCKGACLNHDVCWIEPRALNVSSLFQPESVNEGHPDNIPETIVCCSSRVLLTSLASKLRRNDVINTCCRQWHNSARCTHRHTVLIKCSICSYPHVHWRALCLNGSRQRSTTNSHNTSWKWQGGWRGTWQRDAVGVFLGKPSSRDS